MKLHASSWSAYLAEALRHHLAHRHDDTRPGHHRAEAHRYVAALRPFPRMAP